MSQLQTEDDPPLGVTQTEQLLCRNVMCSVEEEGKVHSVGVACLCGAPGAHRRISGRLIGRGGTRGRHEEEEEERRHSEK